MRPPRFDAGIIGKFGAPCAVIVYRVCSPVRGGLTLIPNALVRVAYRCAYRAARVWWFITRPRTTAAVAALWHDGRLLLVRSSYRPYYTLPGGFLKRGETPAEAASRELREELHISIPADALTTIGWHGSIWFEHHEDTVSICELELDSPPAIRVNGRELVWAGWKTAEEARALPVVPIVIEYLSTRSRLDESSRPSMVQH